MSIDDPQGAIENSSDMKVRDCIQNGSSFSLVGSSSMLAVLASILISDLDMKYKIIFHQS